MPNTLPPMVMLDAPLANAEAAGWVYVSGWAAAGAEPLTPRITVDGQVPHSVLWQVGRPDVVAHYGLVAGLPYGFEGWVDLGDRTGTVRLGLMAEGRDDVEPIEIPLEAGPASTVKHWIDGPTQGTLALDTIEMFGWAYGVTDEIDRIEVMGPGIRQRCDFGYQRADIKTQGISAPAARCGWRATVELSDAPEDLIPLAVVVTDARDARAVRSTLIKRTTLDAPAVEVEDVEPHGERLRMRGYVIWPAPTPAHASVVLARGGEALARAPADRARPDVARRFPERVRDSRCGFELWTPRTDDGPLTLTAIADDGRISRLDLPVLFPAISAASGIPPSSALLPHVGDGSALLDWGVGVDVAGLPLTVFQPPDLGAPTLPQRDSSVDVVVVPRDAAEERVAEARRVAALTVLTPDSEGAGYGVLWSAGDTREWPSVSVVIPVHGQDEVTGDCLRTLLETVPASVELEVLVVDDASPAESTGAMLASWAARDARVRVISLEENVGYLRAVNAGAAEAAGAVLVLLNNDTEPQAGWLEALLSTFTQHPEAGVVGARLLDPDGTLQDAGGVVFSDGSATNLGRGETAGLPAFSFLRPVLYCTAAALATPRALWEEVGGFDERFVPAYYEDVDYCFAVRALGRSVLIQPDAIVVHKEGQSHGTDTGTGIKAHQVENQARFAQKWAAELARFGPRPEAPDAVAARKIQMMGRL